MAHGGRTMTDFEQIDPNEWDAASYHHISTPQLTWGQKMLDTLTLRGDETVMDAGCGTGRLTAELLERLPQGRVIAVDLSQNMLDAAADYLAPFGDRVTFLQADLQEIGLDVVPEPVDLVLSTAAFHWVLDHERLFAGLFETLKPGGWLVAQCGGGPNLAHLFQRAADLTTRPRFAPYFENWNGPWEFADAATTAERLRSAGFIDVETSLESAPTKMPDAAAFREFLTNVIFRAHLARIPDPNLRIAFVDHLTELAEADNPPFLLDYWRLNMKAQRPA
jgi:trans-aconitate 2-methyltransferase